MALNKIGTGAAALSMLAAASSPTLAESADKDPNAAIQLASYTVEQVDCVTHVKNQRDVRKEAGDPMSRKEMKLSLIDCRNSNLKMEIAAQEDYIRELDQKLASLDLQIDQNAQILDEQGRVIGRFISVQGQLEIKRASLEELKAENARINASIDAKKVSIADANKRISALKADTQAKLDQAEAILRALVV